MKAVETMDDLLDLTCAVLDTAHVEARRRGELTGASRVTASVMAVVVDGPRQ
ncbi:hypothetical protein ACFV8T_14190 [Streptomyces sp. NPDC059832]|uniref:hypothetical protein n=1 Tax=Streptomyces sp. NPDC059832 TaxID=3346966 RepID=UPI00365B4F44